MAKYSFQEEEEEEEEEEAVKKKFYCKRTTISDFESESKSTTEIELKRLKIMYFSNYFLYFFYLSFFLELFSIINVDFMEKSNYFMFVEMVQRIITLMNFEIYFNEYILATSGFFISIFGSFLSKNFKLISIYFNFGISKIFFQNELKIEFYFVFMILMIQSNLHSLLIVFTFFKLNNSILQLLIRILFSFLGDSVVTFRVLIISFNIVLWMVSKSNFWIAVFFLSIFPNEITLILSSSLIGSILFYNSMFIIFKLQIFPISMIFISIYCQLNHLVSQ
jgi:hypothetical protein